MVEPLETRTMSALPVGPPKLFFSPAVAPPISAQTLTLSEDRFAPFVRHRSQKEPAPGSAMVLPFILKLAV